MFPTEHLIKLDTEKEFTKFIRKNNDKGEGIDCVYGIGEDKKETLCQIRIRNDRYNAPEAVKYMNDNSYVGAIEVCNNDSGDTVDTMRFDSGEIIGKVTKTAEGYLKGHATVTRTGVFKYKNFDGTIRKELRHPDEVFKADSLDSLKMIPVTNNHPKTRLIDSKVAAKYACGTTGENVTHDSENVLVSFLVTNDKDIKEVENGKRGLSCGYLQMLEPKTGTYNGDDYTHIQRNIKYNHVAIVNKPRAGKSATLNIDSYEESGLYDSNDAVMIDNIIFKSNSDGGNQVMPQTLINNIAYEASQEVINALEGVKTNLDALNTKTETLKKENAELKGRNDSAKDELEKIKKEMPALIEKRVSDRIDLERKAVTALDSAEIKDISTLGNNEIMKKVVLKVFPNAKATLDSDDLDDNYLVARFDSSIEILNENKSKGNVANQRRAQGNRADNADNDTRTVNEKYADRIADRWKEPTK